MDKVQKIREEVARIQLYTQSEVLKQVLDYIDKVQEEPVSEDLEEAAKYYIPDESYHMTIESKEEGSGENVYDYVQMIEMFKAGAKWQEKKDQETIELAEDHAMFAGMEKMEQQMMAKAIDGKVIANGMGNPILHLWDKGRHLIDKKVKVIVIKED